MKQYLMVLICPIQPVSDEALIAVVDDASLVGTVAGGCSR